MDQALFSSEKDDWETPRSLVRAVEKRLFGGSTFDLDVCAKHAQAAKARVFLTPEVDGLKQRWRGLCWCNPPYGRKQVAWVEKAQEESVTGARVVCLIPARTDTELFHTVIAPYARVYFLKGRITFEDEGRPAKSPAAFPSMLVYFGAPGTSMEVMDLR